MNHYFIFNKIQQKKKFVFYKTIEKRFFSNNYKKYKNYKIIKNIFYNNNYKNYKK